MSRLAEKEKPAFRIGARASKKRLATAAYRSLIVKQHIYSGQRSSVRGPDSILYRRSVSALALSVCLAGFSAYADEPVALSEGALRPAITVQQQNEDKLFAVPGVLAVGVGTLSGTRTPAIHCLYQQCDARGLG